MNASGKSAQAGACPCNSLYSSVLSAAVTTAACSLFQFTLDASKSLLCFGRQQHHIPCSILHFSTQHSVLTCLYVCGTWLAPFFKASQRSHSGGGKRKSQHRVLCHTTRDEATMVRVRTAFLHGPRCVGNGCTALHRDQAANRAAYNIRSRHWRLHTSNGFSSGLQGSAAVSSSALDSRSPAAPSQHCRSAAV